VLGHTLASGATILLDKDLSITLNQQNYFFACPLLEAAFVRLTKEQFEYLDQHGVGFLAINLNVHQNQLVHVYQHDASVSSNVYGFWGFDIVLPVSISKRSLGSVITNENAEAVAICKERENGAYVRGVQLATVVGAIKRDFLKNGIKPAPSKPVHLTKDHIESLNTLGLQIVQEGNDTLLVSPPSAFITPIWFVRTQHGWYWTPTEEDSNWMRITIFDSLMVIGGFWHGVIPAEKNVKIIKYLQVHGWQYL